MNFSSEAVASWYGYKKTIPKRRFQRRVGVCRPVSGPCPRGRSPTRPRSSRGVQRAEVGGSHRLTGALHATQPASVGSRLSTDPAVATGGSVRGDGPRFARTLAAFGGQGVRPDGHDTRLAHPALDYREWFPGRLRWSQTQEEGLEGTY